MEEKEKEEGKEDEEEEEEEEEEEGELFEILFLRVSLDRGQSSSMHHRCP